MSGPYLILTAPTGDKTKYPIQQNSIAIGRSEENNDIIVRNDGGVSRWHCRIDYGAGQAHLSDCGSANGTIVNNVEVDSGGFGFKLSDGDIISIGDTVLEYKAPPAPAVPARRSGVDGKRVTKGRVVKKRGGGGAVPILQSRILTPLHTSRLFKQSPANRIAKKAPAKPSRQSSASKPAGGVVSNIKKIEQKREARRAKAQREAEKKKDRQMKMAIKGVTAEGEILDFADMIDVYHEKNEVPKDEVCMGLPMWPNLKIRVCIRKRPLTSKEKNKGGLEGLDVVTCNCTDRSQIAVVHEPKQKVDLSKYMENHPFKFDQVLDETCDNDVSYQCTAAPLVPYVFKGKKATCFAYGQTGSGKTWTMSGEDRIIGVYQMVARDIFKHLQRPEHQSLSVHVSYFEIYQGHVFDLLNKRNRLMVLEDGKGKVGLKGLTEYAVKDTQSLLSAIDKGNSVRRQGSTSANARSSRSHGIFQIFLRTPGRRVKKLYGKFSLIDLAGSERGKDTAHADRRRRIEGAEINKSLLALKECIRAMSDRKGHLPFRASKLTQVLKDSFIGGSRTVMIACVSPSGGNTEHTMNTLRYADRVKEIAGQREPGSARGKVGVVRTPEPIVKQQPPEEEEGTPGNVNWNDYDESDAIKKLQQSLPEEQMDKFMAHSILVSELMRNETRVVDLHKKLLEQQQIWSGDEKKHLTLAMSSEDEYDSDTYASFLEKMVAHKLQALQSLQKEVAKFKKNLAAEQQSSS